MKLFRQLAPIVILLISSAAPAMACLLPGVQMSAAERSCCHAMKNRCGQMQMPASHGCCQQAPATTVNSAIQRKANAFDPSDTISIAQPIASWQSPLSAFDATVERRALLPPKSPLSRPSILRI